MPGSININISMATYERLIPYKKKSWSILLNELLDTYQDTVLKDFEDKLSTTVVPAAIPENQNKGE